MHEIHAARVSGEGSESAGPKRSRLRMRVAPSAESAIRGGHPWVFADSIRDPNRAGETGELAVVYDRKNRFLAAGLFDPHSPIRLRILHSGRPATIDAAWWQRRLRESLARREGGFDSQTNAGRWINGESDGWPGLVLDRYDRALVIKLYTAAWLPRLPEVTEWIRNALRPDRLVVRLSRNLRTLAAEKFNLAEGAYPKEQGGRSGPAADGPVQFLEDGLRFEADILRGQKTGFFLDQRENRRRAGRLARQRDVLNAFSFSGGFSLHAARGGAKSVTDLDLSAHALTASKRNFELNRSNPAIARCHHETVQADAFEWLGKIRNRHFDLIVLDPPSLARREAERDGAIRAYRRLNANGIKLLRTGGILVAASCSAHVSSSEFFNAVTQTAQASGRRFVEIERTGHPPDHPATFEEARYLKCLYLHFEPASRHD